MKPSSPDTLPAAVDAQVNALRRMTPEQRLLLALQMSEDARALAEAGIRQRHPEYSAAQIRIALLDACMDTTWHRVSADGFKRNGR